MREEYSISQLAVSQIKNLRYILMMVLEPQYIVKCTHYSCDYTGVFLLGSLPRPSQPTYSRRGGNFVTLVWSESFCDGGREISSFRIRYRRYYYYYYSYSYITVSDPTQRSYKISGLSYSTTYYFSIRATSTDGRTSSYSPYTTITTLPRCKQE